MKFSSFYEFKKEQLPRQIYEEIRYFYEFASEALHIVIFENFVKSMTSCLSKLKVTSNFCYPFKIPDDPTASTKQSTVMCFQQLYSTWNKNLWNPIPAKSHLYESCHYIIKLDISLRPLKLKVWPQKWHRSNTQSSPATVF